jgi:nitroimidazol reductase NimA-like FMN-containing flavoprotein (pyridoxamine 5'-phosphate oxidase superfamily)
VKLRQFCEGQDLLRLAYVDDEGYPRVVPLYFIRMGDHFIISTWAHSAKWRFIQQRSKVGWVIDAGTYATNYRGVTFWGVLEKVTDQRVYRRAFLAFAMKYFGSTEHPTFLRLFASPGCIFLKLKPERFYSWDNAS